MKYFKHWTRQNLADKFGLKQLITLTILFTIHFCNIKADVPIFNIVEVNYNNTTYYYKFENLGSFKEDFCYYDYQDNYLGETDIFFKELFNSGHKKLYKELHVINFKEHNFFQLPENLYILKKKVLLNFKESYTVIRIIKGNNYGYIYSDNLNQNDNYWLTDYPIEIYFCLSQEVDFCEICFYGIKNNLLEKEKQEIKNNLNSLYTKNDEQFNNEVNYLYTKNIIMIGFCSC